MKYKPKSKLSPHFLLSIALIALPLLLFGCSSGSDGAPGTSLGTVTGTVTDTFNNKVANATVTPSPAVDSLTSNRVSTAADGTFSMTVPAGTYTLTFANPAYATQTLSVSVLAAQTKANTNVVLVPNAAAAVTVTGAATFPATGGVTLTATPVPLDPALKGQTATFEWTDQRGNVLGTTAAITVNKPTAAEFKANVAAMVAPLIGFEANPRNTPDEAGEEGVHYRDVRIFKTLDRLMVVGIPMFAYETAANPTYTVKVTIGGQTFSQTVAVGAGVSGLPFVSNPGLRNVPIGQPVMVQGPDNGETQTTWNFTLTPAAGSAVTALVDPTTRFPHFTPDVVGTYTVTETVSGQSMKIYAGQWVGALKPAAADDPRGVVDPGCLSAGLCHSPATLSKFAEWKRSGHSEVMVIGMAEGSHYDLARCGKCHSVGGTYLGADTSAGSFRDVAAAAGFTNATFLGKLIPSLSEAVKESSPFFQGFPQVLQLSEIQCENCHGPNSNGDVHGPAAGKTDVPDANAARVNLSAEVCAPCHGEPRRHGRFQEWRESGHGEIQLAIDEGVTGVATATPFGTGPNTGCAGCHTGQGYLQLIQQLQAGNPLRTIVTTAPTVIPAVSGLRTNNVQPITCATCHTPHDAGRQPGLVGNVVMLRGDFQAGGSFDGSTPLLPGGFQANGLGRGALCVVCHNSRNGGLGTFADAGAPPVAALHEDGNRFFGLAWTSTTAPLAYSAARLTANTFVTAFTNYASPHEAAQGDALMGRNAYFFGTGLIGQRSKHALLADACVTCHLQKTPATPAFGVDPTTDGAGTNHSFGIITDPARTAEEQVNALCQQCHGSFEGTGVQRTFESANKALLTELAIRTYLLKMGRTPAQDGFTIDTDVDRVPAVGDLKVTFIPGRAPVIIVNGTRFNLGRATISAANVVTQEGWLTTVVLGATPDAAVFTGITTQAASGTATSNLPPAGIAVPADQISIVPRLTVLNNRGMDAILAKANWNASLVEGDASKGVHNPSFTQDVITATIAALKSIQ